MNKKKRKVLIAMSGGVDSSVSALLLKKSGYEVVGVTMCFGIENKSDADVRCCGLRAVEDARAVCNKLGISHHIWDFSKDLKNKVITKFIDEYIHGRTPNPCIECNKHLKFNFLLKKALVLGFDYISTGHYASIIKKSNCYFLRKPKDKVKDQTYFLYPIKYEYLKNILFPLGNYTKGEVREIAKKENLIVANKTESQDICFINSKNYHKFLKERIQEIKKGLIKDLNGRILGEHNGICFYTIGQRKGLKISSGIPIYVISIDPVYNIITAGEDKYLLSRGLIAKDVNFLVKSLNKNMSAKIRYNQKEVQCNIDIINDMVKVIFKQKQRAVAPGQSVVFYHKDILVGGGIIASSFN